MSETAIQVVIEFDRTLLNHFTVAQFNAFIGGLLSRGLTPPIFVPGDTDPDPIAIMIDFNGLRRPHYDLDHIDLRMCWLADADFTGASLRHARMGCGRNVCYRDGARLHGADFRGVEISGSDFTGALGLDTAQFDGAVYCPSNPPVGLPASVMALCKPEAAPPLVDRRSPSNPMEPSGYRQSPLRCSALIHAITFGE